MPQAACDRFHDLVLIHAGPANASCTTSGDTIQGLTNPSFPAAICRVRCGAIYSPMLSGNAARIDLLGLHCHSLGIGHRLARIVPAIEPICPVASGFKQARYRGAVLGTKLLTDKISMKINGRWRSGRDSKIIDMIVKII